MMRQPPIYADYNATAPLREVSRHAMVEAMQADGNPSSVHQFGRQARRAIEDARASILRHLGAQDYRLVFTSGATEALGLVLRPSADKVRTVPEQGGTTRLFVATTEHVAAREGHSFDAPADLPVDAEGLLKIDALESYLANRAENETALVCVHGANNETGVVQPIETIAEVCADHGALFVSDLVQWIGRLPIPARFPDAMVISAHKLGGPAGVGALIYNPTTLTLGGAALRGGGQEMGDRAGTENRIGIVGFAAALQEAVATQKQEAARLAELRDGFEAAIRQAVPGAVFFGVGAPRLPNTSCFALPGREASLGLMQLDLAGVALSSGSACSSGKVKASHVLKAMGVPDDLAACALRLSIGYQTSQTDIERIVAALVAGR